MLSIVVENIRKPWLVPDVKETKHEHNPPPGTEQGCIDNLWERNIGEYCSKSIDMKDNDIIGAKSV